MIEFDFDKYCTACSACIAVCPGNAICFKQNSEGFQMPVITTGKCINCGKCTDACPHLSYVPTNNLADASSYHYRYEGLQELMHSASGGAFYALAVNMLQKCGSVCGCVWDENHNAKHIVSNSLNDVHRMQSSKYVQSDMGSCFSVIRGILSDGKWVLFSGTPCQTAGLLTYLPDRLKDNLLTVSLICHGVPSPGVWQQYVNELECKYRSRLISCNHRSKIRSYHQSMCEYNLKHTNIYLHTFIQDSYVSGFLYNIYLRNSCYNCKYKGENLPGDIIIGDTHDSVRNETGTSLVISLSEKGDALLRNELEAIEKIHIPMLKQNYMLMKSVLLPPKRDLFFDLLEKSGFSAAISRCLPAICYVKRFLYRLGLFDVAAKAYRKAKG